MTINNESKKQISLGIEGRREQIERVINRGIIVDIIPSIQEFKEKLINSEGLKIYIGADPTSSSLHLSHAKNYMLLEELRKLGCEVYVLIGDFTARIGDPTDNSTARKKLTEEQIQENVKDWRKQIKPLIDFNAKENPAKIVYNADWLSRLTMKDVVELVSNMTVQRMLERDMFEKRLKENQPIYLHEFIYPLMQGYDSVHLGVDAELCGTDQIFNALVGRTLEKKYKNKDKFVIAVNLMENPKTKTLMSKSKGTGVFLNATPEDMYGQIMAQPDEMVEILLINNTRISLEKVDEIIKMENSMDAKKITAQKITEIFHGKEESKKAEESFIKKIQKKEAPEDIQEFDLANKNIIDALVESKLVSSKSDARRAIEQGGVKINSEVIKDFDTILKSGDIVQKGKRFFAKVK
ncbi:MAG: tyrosine--tRNA ligase [Patescibacteria group bacterium]